MTTTRLRDTGRSEQSPTTGIVPSRMSHVADWETDDVRLEVYLDHRSGDGCLITSTEDYVAGIAAAGGVLRHVAWAGRWLERGTVWCQTVRARCAAEIAGDDR